MKNKGYENYLIDYQESENTLNQTKLNQIKPNSLHYS